MTLAQAIPVVIGVLMIFAVSFSMFRLHRSRSRPDRDGFSE